MTAVLGCQLHVFQVKAQCNVETYDFNLHRNFPKREPRNEHEHSHEDGEPELLFAKQGVGIVSPHTRLDVVGVPKDNERPGRRKTEPSDESVVSLESVVMIAGQGVNYC